MTALQHELSTAHPSDALTTVARVRLYDTEARDTQRLGFNCRAEDFLNLTAIGDYLRSIKDDKNTSAHTVSELMDLDSIDKPFVTAAYEVSPPLSEESQQRLGELLVAGTFWRDPSDTPEAVMLIDNTGLHQPDSPMDRGRAVINQTPVRPRLVAV